MTVERRDNGLWASQGQEFMIGNPKPALPPEMLDQDGHAYFVVEAPSGIVYGVADGKLAVMMDGELVDGFEAAVNKGWLRAGRLRADG